MCINLSAIWRRMGICGVCGDRSRMVLHVQSSVLWRLISDGIITIAYLVVSWLKDGYTKTEI